MKKNKYSTFYLLIIICIFNTHELLADDVNKNTYFIKYSFKHGDIISEIAMKFYGTCCNNFLDLQGRKYNAVDILQKINNIKNLNTIKKGQEILLPNIENISDLSKAAGIKLNSKEVQNICTFRFYIANILLENKKFDQAKSVCEAALLFYQKCEECSQDYDCKQKFKKCKDLLGKIKLKQKEHKKNFSFASSVDPQKSVETKPMITPNSKLSSPNNNNNNTSKAINQMEIQEIVRQLVEKITKNQYEKTENQLKELNKQFKALDKRISFLHENLSSIKTAPKVSDKLEYYIEHKDTLNKISLKFFGDKKHVKCILRSNPLIKNPNHIIYGMKLIIPKICEE